MLKSIATYAHDFPQMLNILRTIRSSCTIENQRKKHLSVGVSLTFKRRATYVFHYETIFMVENISLHYMLIKFMSIRFFGNFALIRTPRPYIDGSNYTLKFRTGSKELVTR